MTMERRQNLLLLSSVDRKRRSIPTRATFALLDLAIPESASA
jgi:hypothetical protein